MTRAPRVGELEIRAAVNLGPAHRRHYLDSSGRWWVLIGEYFAPAPPLAPELDEALQAVLKAASGERVELVGSALQ